ncbi:MAG: cytochrome c [Roseiflexaceae bacterium]|nr:cytochrome c [Roseiflexaceae bacterium]
MSASRRPILLLLVLAIVFGGVLVATLLFGRPPVQDGATTPQSLGASLFRTRCASCHATTTQAGVGPGLAGLFAAGGPALPPGVDYNGRLPTGDAITEESVAAFIRAGGRGQIGAMPGFRLSDQETAALLAYLKTL